MRKTAHQASNAFLFCSAFVSSDKLSQRIVNLVRKMYYARHRNNLSDSSFHNNEPQNN